MFYPLSGYFVALVAFLWPALVKSVVLVNSAGNVVPGYSPIPIPRVRIISMHECLSDFQISVIGK